MFGRWRFSFTWQRWTCRRNLTGWHSRQGEKRRAFPRTAGIVRTRVCGHKTGVLKPENLGWNCRNSRRCSWEAPRGGGEGGRFPRHESLTPSRIILDLADGGDWSCSRSSSRVRGGKRRRGARLVREPGRVMMNRCRVCAICFSRHEWSRRVLLTCKLRSCAWTPPPPPVALPSPPPQWCSGQSAPEDRRAEGKKKGKENRLLTYLFNSSSCPRSGTDIDQISSSRFYAQSTITVISG